MARPQPQSPSLATPCAPEHKQYCNSTKENSVAEKEFAVVVGLGEVGRPLMNILARTYDCAGIDIDPVQIESPVSVLHVCYPFQIPHYVQTTADYVRRLNPGLVILHSTVPPGTTRQVQNEVPDALVAFSPVRGKHVRMEQDMMRYTKFVAGTSPQSEAVAADHLRGAGFEVATFPSPEIAEMAKLLETTYLGMLIAWTQEMERLASQYGGSFEDVNSFVKEVDFLPAHVFPGVIGGHCVLPNIELLRARVESPFLNLIVDSNSLKAHGSAVGAGVNP
jgi:UDP-N-acetyl-D-mannosaminuronate dehydrogenase